MNSVGWFEIYVENLERAKKFYETVFNVTLEKVPNTKPEMEMWAFPGESALFGAMGAIVRMPGVKPGVGGTLIYFNSIDCLTEEQRVADAGGQVVQSKFSIGEYGYISIVNDSEGNTIGLHSSDEVAEASQAE